MASLASKASSPCPSLSEEAPLGDQEQQVVEVHLRCVGPRGFTCAVWCVLSAPSSSGEIVEQEQFVLRRELCTSMKMGRREVARPHDKTPKPSTFFPSPAASPPDLLLPSESGLGLRAPGTADGQR